MPKVVDAARVTTRKSAVWRTCSGCGLLAALPPEVDRCSVCDRPVPSRSADRVADAGWEHANRYAEAIGRITAFAVLIPDLTDAERVTHIRQALTDLDNHHQDGGQH